MKTKLSLLVALVGASAAFAQGPEMGPSSPVIEALDRDKNGELSAEEIAAASELLAELDADHNGRLSEEETQAKPGQSAAIPRQDEGGDLPAPPVESALDRNGDGTISKSELSRAAKSLLELDVDGSGQLEKEELAPELPEGDDKEAELGGLGSGGRRPRPPRH